MLGSAPLHIELEVNICPASCAMSSVYMPAMHRSQVSWPFKHVACI